MAERAIMTAAPSHGVKGHGRPQDQGLAVVLSAGSARWPRGLSAVGGPAVTAGYGGRRGPVVVGREGKVTGVALAARGE